MEARFLDFYKLPVSSELGGETPGLLPKLSILSKPGGETPGLLPKLSIPSKHGGEIPGLLPKLSIPSKHGGETPGLFKNFHFHQELEARFLDLIQRSGFVKTWMKDS